MSGTAVRAQRIREGLEARGMTQKELCELTGIPKSAMSQYCSGAFAPKQARTAAIAKALSVSEAWLMGCDVPMEAPRPSPVKLRQTMTSPWRSDKKSRLYMCIDSWLLSALEAAAQEDKMPLEDKIEELLYWEIERLAEEQENEALQVWLQDQ